MSAVPMSQPVKLLIVVNVFRPDLGGGTMFTDLAEGLAERGMDVTVRCAYPYYPEWKDKTGENGLRIKRYAEGGVSVERFGLFIPRDPNSLVQRMLYEASFFLSLLRSVPRSGRFDAVMAFCPLVGGVAFGATTKLIHRRPLWLNVQDISTDAAAAGGIISSGWVARTFDAVQRFLFNRADTWCTLSPVMRDRLDGMRSRGQTIHLLPNWMHRTLNEAMTRHRKPDGHTPQRPVRLLYSGNLGSKQNLLEFCQTLHESPAGFDFDIRAAGSYAGELQAWLSEVNDARFSFRGLSDEDGLAEGHRLADFVVITEKSGAGGSFVPGKLVPAAVSGTPVLALCDAESPLGREVTEHDLGPSFRWHQMGEAVGMVSRIPDQPDTYRRWVTNSLTRASFYDRDRVIDTYFHELTALASAGYPTAVTEPS